MSRIEHLTLLERIKITNVTHSSREEYIEARIKLKSIQLLQAKVAESPQEWVYWYALCDDLYAYDDYLGAVQAAQKCYDLRPNDPRSTFCLAVAYKFVAMAKLGNNPAYRELYARAIREGHGTEGLANITQCERALKELGITSDQAARRSMHFFEETIKLGITASDKQNIDRSLEMIRDKLLSS